jgi:Tfp pilus assembly protein PilX
MENLDMRSSRGERLGYPAAALDKCGSGIYRAERGVVLFIALIVLVALSLAAVALVRSVDTGNIIAGNLAFKQSTINAADLGIEAAMDALGWITQNNLDANLIQAPSVTTNKYWYYATRRQVDSRGVPTTKEQGAGGTATAIDWSSVPIISTMEGNDVRVVIDRLCLGPAPVTDVQQNCFFDDVAGDTGTKKTHESVFSGADSLYYRVTVRVAGPRNTVSMVQAIVTY